MSKGTILYFGGFELPDKNAAAHRVFANSKLLSIIGYDVVLIGVKKGVVKYSQCATKTKIDEFDVWERPYPNNYYSWLDYLVNARNAIKIIESYKNIKAIICYNYQAIPLEILRNYCRNKNINIISDCTEWYSSYDGNILFKTLKFLDTNLRMRLINRKVDSLIVVSDYLKEYYHCKKCVVIPTLVYKKNDFKPNYNYERVTKFVYAGTPFKLGKVLKNRELAKDRLDIALNLLYMAMIKGEDFIFDIYGITEEEYLEVLPDDKYIIRKMESYVFFHGRRNNDYVQYITSNADFTLLIRNNNLTTKAGFPTKFSESINLNVPVITTKTSDLSKYLIEGRNGFFINIDNPDYDIEKFCKILSLESSQKKAMKDYCYETKIFDIKKWKANIEKIL